MSAGHSAVQNDVNASGGHQLLIWDSAVAWGTFTLPSDSSGMDFRVRANSCQGSPNMVVQIDGQTVLSAPVTSSTWSDVTTTHATSAGTHSLAVNFNNDLYVDPSCDRNLYIDAVTFVPGNNVNASSLLFVSPTGNDNASGTINSPLATLTRAGVLAKPGATVYVRGGTYHRVNQVVTAHGTAGAPITFTAYPGETPVLDGDGLWLPQNLSILMISGSSYVTVHGLEVARSQARGVDVYGSDHVIISGCKIHDIYTRALGGESDNLTFDSNEVYNAVMNNQWGQSSSGWSAAIGFWLKPDGSYLHNVTITNNRVHDSWGECVVTLFVNGGLVTKNEIHDCWSTNLYLDHGSNIVVDRNYIYATTDDYNKPSTQTRATGIGLANEDYPGIATSALDGLTITNNLVGNVGLGINFWGNTGNWSSSNTYRNVRVENNVVTGTARAGISFDPVYSGSSETPYGCTIRNNIIGKAWMDGSTVSLGDFWAFSVQANDFPGGVPGAFSGSGNFSADPKFTSPAMGSNATGFQLQSGSPCHAAGVASNVISSDFWGNARNGSHPSVGIHESY